MGDTVQNISKAIISFFDLLEAEGRNLKKSTVAVVEGLIVVFFAMALIFVGAVVALISLYLWLGQYIGRAGSAAIVAVLFFIIGSVALAKAHSGFTGGEKDESQVTAPAEGGGQDGE